MKLNPSPRRGVAVPEADGLILERFLPYRLSTLTLRISNAIARSYERRFNLSVPEWRVMAVLGRFGPLSANGVGEKTQMDKVRVSRAVARLLTANRITRRTDTEDRRRAILDLTPKGRADYEQIVPMVLAVESELLSELDGAERVTLERIMRKLEARTAADFAGAIEDVDG